MSDQTDPEPTPDEPIDGGNRPAVEDGQDEDGPATDRPVGDFGDEERADPGGDSDVDPATSDRGEER